ncbi:OLC1v1024998C1 [Oldenlandia corymbosa var. corymbosa]|uniref:OLC1v1024998C1 n=1 Tax=Oldenlandia corymbosa var. corymbosa TaxID=529605 RepID=A0AAV1C4K4_OLDCO|nr:OLC1v1024998C1 [Oldenlandia corymbosa var. corymbosa]
MDYELQSSGFEKEKKVLTTKLESLENDVDSLRKKISKKNDEVEEERKVKEQLLQQIDLHNIEKVKQDRKYEEVEKEKLHNLEQIKHDQKYEVLEKENNDSQVLIIYWFVFIVLCLML